MDISDCGRFLASCSNDLSVNIWDLAERRPIAVFRDHKTPACALAFYQEEYKDRHGVLGQRCYFASVSEDGILNLYAEEDFGTYRRNIDQINLIFAIKLTMEAC